MSGLLMGEESRFDESIIGNGFGIELNLKDINPVVVTETETAKTSTRDFDYVNGGSSSSSFVH